MSRFISGLVITGTLCTLSAWAYGYGEVSKKSGICRSDDSTRSAEMESAGEKDGGTAGPAKSKGKSILN